MYVYPQESYLMYFVYSCPSANSLYGHMQLTLYWGFLYVYHMCCVLK